MAEPDLERLFPEGARVTLFHAHPDDETLATGALIAWLVERGHPVDVLTATRGEQGEIVPGSAADGLSPVELVQHRQQELAAALKALGAAGPTFLGSGTARVPGLAERRYTDSGMRWLDEAQQVAGPGASAGADSLTAADPVLAAADLAAHLRATRSEILISYDHLGGYGHPDHVACHEIARLAVEADEVKLLAVVSDPATGEAGTVRAELSRFGDVVRQALAQYSSQLSLEPDTVVHVGGQRQPISTEMVLVAAH